MSIAAFQVTPKSRRSIAVSRPEGRGDLAAERVLGLAEIACVQDDRLRHAVNGEVARHLPVRRVDGLDAGALEGDGRMVLAAEQVGVHETAHEPIVGHVDAGHRDRRGDRRRGGPSRDRTRAIPRARESPCGTSRSPCSVATVVSALGPRHLAHPLVEAPAVALEVERLVGAMAASLQT